MPSQLVTIEEAYRATDYVVFTESTSTVIRIGKKSSAVDRLLLRFHCRSAAYVTAWNPYGKTLSNIQNGNRHRQLIAQMRARGQSYLMGEGRGEIGDWPPELSILVFGVDQRRAEAIGRDFRQNAIVYVELNRPASLLMLRSPLAGFDLSGHFPRLEPRP